WGSVRPAAWAGTGKRRETPWTAPRCPRAPPTACSRTPYRPPPAMVVRRLGRCQAGRAAVAGFDDRARGRRRRRGGGGIVAGVLVNNTGYAAAEAVLMDADGRDLLLVVAKTGYRWRPDGSLEPLEAVPAVAMADVFAGPPATTG